MHFEHLITKLRNSASTLPIKTLLSGTALLLFSPTMALAAPDACPIGAGGILQCSGNQSAGIILNDVNGVRVFNLSQDINPASPLDAISVVNVPGAGPPKPIDIRIDPTTKIIRSTGGKGINANTVDGTINILNSASIISANTSIEANSSQMNVTISQNGNIRSSSGNGITAISNNGGVGGSVIIANTGSLITGLTGIVADAHNNVSISNSGAGIIASGGIASLFASGGIFGKSTIGFVDVQNTANITVKDDAISATADGTDTIVIKSQGDLNSSNAMGIVARANSSGGISIESKGKLTGRNGGIFASIMAGTSNISIVNNGDLNSSDGFGIEVNNGFGFTGDVNIKQFDKIDALTNAIKVESRGDINITGFGTLNSTIGSTILVNQFNPPSASTGKTTVELRGAIVSSHDGSALELNGKDVRVDTSTAKLSSSVMPTIKVNGFNFVRIALDSTVVAASIKGGPPVSAIEALTSGPGNMQLVFSQTNTTGKETRITSTKNGVEATTVAGDLSVTASTAGSPAGAISLFVDVPDTGFDLHNLAGNTAVSLQDAVFQTGKTGIFSRNINPSIATTIRQGISLKNSKITAGTNGIEAVTLSGVSQFTVDKTIINAKNNGIDLAGDIWYLTILNKSEITGNNAGINVVGISTNLSGFRAVVKSGSKISGKTGIKLVNLPTSQIFIGDSEVSGTIAAIVSTGGTQDDVEIQSGGVVNGSINLDDGLAMAGDLDNLKILSGGMLNAGATINLGRGYLSNFGTLSPGGKGLIQTTKISVGASSTGSRGFENQSNGVIEIDLKKNNISDKIEIKGRWNLNGKVAPNLISLGSTGTFDIIKGDAAELGIKKITVHSTPGLKYGLQYISGPGATTILQLTANRVALGGLTGGSNNNGGIFGKHLDKGVNATGEHPLFQQYINGLATQPTKSKLQQGLKEGAGEANVAPTATSRAASQAFSGQLMSCPVDSGSLFSAIDEGQCAWVNGITRYVERDGDAGTIELAERASGIAGGFQSKISENWFFGAALSYEDVRISTDIGASSSGERFHAGVVAKYVNGANKVAISAYGGAGWFDSTRAITIPFAANAVSSQNLQYYGANLRLSHTFKPGDDAAWSITPMVDFATNYAHTNGFAETGAGGLNLTYSDNHNTIFSISPAIEFTNESELTSGGSLRAYARFGATYTNDNNTSFNVTLQNAPASSGSFESFTGFDDFTGDVHVGLDFVKEKWFARLQADGKFGATTRAIGANLKIGVNF